jgi:dTMP kinase
MLGMLRRHGKLIAIEGIDQAGKRTQAHLLAAQIRKRGRCASVWSFPDYGTPIGKQLGAYLNGKLRLDVRAVHLLYAANKWEVAGKLDHSLDQGDIVIVNRYSPSNIAYGLAHGLPGSWLRSLEAGLPKPDRVVVLDIPLSVSVQRKRERRDVHEGNLPYLKRVRKEYHRLAKRYGWKIVDGTQRPRSVQKEVWHATASALR